MLTKGCCISGIGSYLPSNVHYNDYFRDTLALDTSDEWIKSRTGIEMRHFANPDQNTSDLAFEAANVALQNANIKSSDLDAIIVATTTPDKVFPSTATILQKKLNCINNIPAFDIQAVCSGFIYALVVANSLMLTAKMKNILVVGAEKLSSILDWEDRSTCILFGDGAGAVVLSAIDDTGAGIISSKLYSDGSLGDILYTQQKPNLSSQTIYMSGREVYSHAVSKLSDLLMQELKDNDLTTDDIDFFVPHQANVRIIDSIVKRVNLNKSNVISVVDKCANTSAASIPIALHEIIKSRDDKKIPSNSCVVLAGIGAGMTWGSLIYRHCTNN